MTLPTRYQRWLYQDYAYLWRQQSAATRQQYASAGSRYHLTGFQYWMKDMLTRLPDIVGMWHLDEKAGTTAKDFSRNANDGTIFGASPSVGRIDGDFSFDGINDIVNFGAPAVFNVRDYFTLEFFVYLDRITDGGTFGIVSRLGAYREPWILIRLNDAIRFLASKTGAAWDWINNTLTPLIAGITYCIHITFDKDVGSIIYLDGQFEHQDFTTGLIKDEPTTPLVMGFRTNYFKGDLDHFVYYNRVLDTTEMERHAERRWPE